MAGSETLTAHPAPLISRLPSGILLWAGLAFTVAFACGRASPGDASALLLLLAPLLWLPVTPATRIADGWCAAAILLGLAWQGWMVVVQLAQPSALPAGWWRVAEHAAALAVCLFLAVSGGEARHQLRLFGVGATAALLLATGVGLADGLVGPLQTTCFGFGHINLLMNTAGPALLAWLVLCIDDRRDGRRIPVRDLLLLGVGLACLLVLALGTGRRGVLVAYGAAGAWFLWRWLRERSARAATTVALVAAVAAVGAVWWLLAAAQTAGRFERVAIYRAALESAPAAFPWGYGYYGALHLQWADGEQARHLTASGGWGTHAHSELLDTLLDGGPLALLLLCTLLGLLALRVAHLRDRGVRLAWQAAGAAVAVHLLTDNCYGTMVGLQWCGVAAGLVLAAPTASAWAWKVPLPRARMLMWPLVAASAWGATHAIYPAVLDKDADAAARAQCLEQALEPQTVDLHGSTLIGEAWDDLGALGQPRVIAMEVGKVGWTGSLAVAQARWALEAGTPAARLEAFLRILRFTPFSKPTYEQLARLLTSAPGLLTRVPPALSQRLAYLAGRADLPTPTLVAAVGTIDEAADLDAALHWWIATGRPWPATSAPLQGLVHRYGDVPDVALFALECATTAPPESFPALVGERDMLLHGLRLVPAGVSALLERAAAAPDGGAAARALQPLAWSLWRETIADCERGATPPADADEQSVRLRSAVVRLWGRLREQR